jgi:hypothetical protein
MPTYPGRSRKKRLHKNLSVANRVMDRTRLSATVRAARFSHTAQEFPVLPRAKEAA